MPSEPFSQPEADPELTAHSTEQPVVPTPLPSVLPGSAGPGAPTTPPGSSPLTDSGLTPNVAAGLAVLLTIVTGLIFLFLEKRNQFVRYWAMQSVFFGAATFVYVIVAGVVGSILAHILWLFAILWWLCCCLINLVLLGVWIVMLVKAFSGKEWEVPIVGPLARKQLDSLPRV